MLFSIKIYVWLITYFDKHKILLESQLLSKVYIPGSAWKLVFCFVLFFVFLVGKYLQTSPSYFLFILAFKAADIFDYTVSLTEQDSWSQGFCFDLVFFFLIFSIEGTSQHMVKCLISVTKWMNESTDNIPLLFYDF